jgi:hypothetical protein
MRELRESGKGSPCDVEQTLVSYQTLPHFFALPSIGGVGLVVPCRVPQNILLRIRNLFLILANVLTGLYCKLKFRAGGCWPRTVGHDPWLKLGSRVRGGLVPARDVDTANPLEFGGERKTIGKL